jgi:hypothetical protein
MVQKYLSKLSRLKNARNTTDSYWQEVADLFLPKRDFTVTRIPGQKRMSRIYDNTGMNTVELLASSLHGRLTSAYSKWFALKARANVEDSAWLDDVGQAMFDTFTNPASLFASQSYEMYLDVVAFGMGVMFVSYADGAIMYRSRALRDCWVQENARGQIDTLYWTSEMYPQDVINEFGEENVHKNVLEAVKNGKDGKIKVLHLVEPRDYYKTKNATKKYKKFKSCYVDMDNQHEMKEDGYDSFPYLVPRFSKRSGETYGYGPAMTALPAVRVLNEMGELMLRAAAKGVDPVTLLPVDGAIMPWRLDPGGINFYNPDIGEPKPFNTGFRPDYFEFMIKSLRESVAKTFYVDWLNLPQLDRMTTVEVQQRTNDSLSMLSPVLSRLEAELLSPLIERTFTLMFENGMLPLPPEELQGVDFTIEYTSPIAQAQRSANSNSLLQAIGVMAQVAQFDQGVAANFNGDVIVRDMALNTFNLPVKYLRTEEELAQIKQAQQEAQQGAMMAQQAEQYSKAAGNAAGAVKDLGAV